MQRVKNLCVRLIDCIYQCFRSEKDEYQERMIELEECLNRPSLTKNRQQQPDVFLSPKSQLRHLSRKQSPSKQFEEPIPLILDLEGRKDSKDLKRTSSRSQDSFISINSGVRSSQSLSRRTFKKVKSIKSLKKGIGEGLSSKNNQFKQITNEIQSFYEPSLNLIRLDSEFHHLPQMLIQWNQKQYEASNLGYTFQLAPAEKSKICSGTFLDDAVNKLEDYYTFYFTDIEQAFETSGKKEQIELHPSQGWFFRKSPQFKCFYHCENEHLPTDNEIFMMAISFKCNTTNTIEFLKWYNRQSTQAKLFNFQKTKLIENGSNPILQIEQYGGDSKQRTSYLLVRQIQVVKFDDDSDCQYVLQLDTTFRKGKSFKSLLRFQNSDNGLVQIYCESNQNLRTKTQDYYMKKWEVLDKIIREKSLRFSANQVFN